MEKISYIDGERNEVMLHKNQRGKEYPISNRKKGGYYLECVHLA
jgi:hypothetical protein